MTTDRYHNDTNALFVMVFIPKRAAAKNVRKLLSSSPSVSNMSEWPKVPFQQSMVIVKKSFRTKIVLNPSDGIFDCADYSDETPQICNEIATSTASSGQTTPTTQSTTKSTTQSTTKPTTVTDPSGTASTPGF